MKSNESAFPVPPCHISLSGQIHIPEPGMSLRYYFATKAMQGLLASGINYSESHEQAKALADRSVLCADALIERLGE